MSVHYIILSSSYSLGTRICLDIADDASKANTVAEIKESCGYDVSLSYHTIKTDSVYWSSVTGKDAFFSHVQKIDDVKEFIGLIKKDRELSAMDVARYIISVMPCSNLKLQKLLYLCYADYLSYYKKHLFEGEAICALPYGPVVSSVLDFFKGRRNVLSEEDFDISQDCAFLFAVEYCLRNMGTRSSLALIGRLKTMGHCQLRSLLN